MITGLLGRNINYSLSPKIHNNYYLEHSLDLQYRIFDLNEEQIAGFIGDLRKNNIIGFNVTIPYKQVIINYLNSIDDIANKIGAVNTVLVRDSKLKGYNTDYNGFILSLKHKNICLNKKRGLIIGSGGSARCVYFALKNLGIEEIHVLTRDLEKAKVSMGFQCKFLDYRDYELSMYDIIVNCTPLGGANFPDSLPVQLHTLNKDTIVYDLNYSPEKSRLLTEAEKRGAVIINGKTMLEEQAHDAIKIWVSNMERGDKNSEVT